MEKNNFKLLILPSVSNMQQVADKSTFPVALTKGHFKNLEIIFKNGEVSILHEGIDLQKFSLVWLSSSWNSRDLAYAIRLYLDHHNIPNTYVEKGTSKLTDHMLFSLNNLPSPNTLYLGHKELEKSLVIIKNTCGYPLIIKDLKGSQGAHSAKINTEKELLETIKILPKHKRYLFQKYIANEYDWGIMVANGIVVSGEKRYPCEGEFRNNICKGGTEVFFNLADIPQNIKKLAIKASEALGLVWSRSDIMIDKKTKKPFLLEVNRLPGITSKTSEVSGASIFLSSQLSLLAKKASENL